MVTNLLKIAIALLGNGLTGAVVGGAAGAATYLITWLLGG